jgi:hypothetical protein
MKTKFLPKTWWGWIFWLMLVGIVGLLAVRSLLLWLSPDAPGYLDMCMYDNGPCEGAPPRRIHLLKLSMCALQKRPIRLIMHIL